ncbi:MAG: zinc-dependent metalloprotease [Phycisphaerae bacterium]
MKTRYRSCAVPLCILFAVCATAVTLPYGPPALAGQGEPGGKKKDKDKKKKEFPDFKDVAKDFEKVVSTADGQASLYTLWTRKKDGQMLAELPGNFEKQRLFFAYTISGGITTAGVQYADLYAHWKRYDKRLALIEPNVAVRTSGDLESKKGRARVYTDRVVLDVPIVTMGPGGGPVIDVDELLVGQASKFFGFRTKGANTKLATIAKAKAFPKNIELAFELPLRGGRIGTLAYSISVLPDKTDYKPRKADARIGYFTTTHRDVGKPGADTPWVRYVNRWHLEKADPKLKLSPPKQPIVFYLEHTTPVRYRRWVREGVLEWNKAYERVGIINAIEVYQQDARTGAHMEKDPEDARYNFVLWTNAGMGFAIGPSRVDPKTGQILDADIVMDEGFISSWARAWRQLIPQTAMEGFGPETLAWLDNHPDWDPRVLLAPPAERSNVLADLAMKRAMRAADRFAGHPAASADPSMLGDDRYDGLAGRVSQINGACMHAMAKSLDVALFRLGPDIFAELARGGDDDDNGDDDGDDDDDDGKDEDKEQELDGVPESFIGPLLKDVVMHEVGHTLGLRHNFKASSIRTVQEINTEAYKGKAQTASVMDYNPININVDDGPVQGDYTMVTIGPYDHWAIEYGYSFEKDLKPILARVSEEDLPYATDEDTWGPDPLARRFDYGADPLDYADSQMRLVKKLRTKILDRMVKEGDSWAKARRAYEILLGRQFGAVAISANWIGGAHVHRDKKGDPGDRDPIEVVPAEKQRRAMRFVIENTFRDDAFGLTPELLAKMTVDKWWDEGGFRDIFNDPTWPVHDRIMGIQAAALTMMMNPTTLNRVFDNEFRTPDKEDAMTLPEVLFGITDEVWSELNGTITGSYTARKPLVSSLRRNLQREHLERLIDLSMLDSGFGASGKAIATLCCFKLHELVDRIDGALGQSSARIDPYTLAHLGEAKVRIQKALDAQYVYNLDDIRVNAGATTIIIGQPQDDRRPTP